VSCHFKSKYFDQGFALGKQLNYDETYYLTGRITMPSAFVLINVESGSEDSVLKQIRSIANIIESYVSYGVYDLVIKVKSDSMNELKEIVTYKIRAISNVRSTLTLMIIEE
jgi:DNA-binding Lrp family transcriptional regulator